MLNRISSMLTATAMAAALTVTGAAPAHADDAWARQLIEDFAAARAVTKGEGVTVAVLGSGVDRGTPSLRGRVEQEKDFVGTPRPRRLEGSLTAALLAGEGAIRLEDGGPAADGLATGVRILPVRVVPEEGDPGAEDWWEDVDSEGRSVAQGIRYAAERGAQVIVVGALMDMVTSTAAMSDAIAYARSKNAVVIAANMLLDVAREDNFPYPASLPGVIAVNGLQEDGRRHPLFSRPSVMVLVSAPADEHPVEGPDGRVYSLRAGPVAMAWVAAAAAFVKAKYPDLAPVQVARALAASARHPNGEGAYDTSLGFGVVNPDGALKEAAEIAAKGKPVITARSGIFPEGEHFGGDKPDLIGAARHPVAAMAGFPALMLAGVAALAGAFWLWRRPRAAEPGAGESADAAGA
ncbi:S8 family serine peptidase [Thermomonospora amylolytica]|uniref:S8 family serine peptidase n=1 Tax=Thermomonospora amylolytica TaxID=1411117 RepID=UPI001300821A|nr:S8 family serine peptidase [Thermomonospora amylolytica]